MKPKTKQQKEVWKLSQSLRPITDAQRYHAFTFHTCHGIRTKTHTTCLECGHKWKGHETVCPLCGEVLTARNDRKTVFVDKQYYMIATVKGGYQVLRFFLTEKHYRGKLQDRRCWEVVQRWISPDGRVVTIARGRNMCFHYVDSWTHGDMEIRQAPEDFPYQIYPEGIYYKSRVLPILKRNGLNKIPDLPPERLMRALLTDNYAERLLKIGQEDVLRYHLKEPGKVLDFWQQVVICTRHKYMIPDASLWFDYLRLLRYFQMDICNPKYLCPEDLNAEHDRLLARKRRNEERRNLEMKLADARKWEAQYQKEKEKFFGICFGDKDIVVTVIKSVAEMAEEGTAMHHCVYQMGYYKKPNSLILSAKDNQGNRIETVEVNTLTFEVVQSRGVCNSNTPQHKKIIDLVNQNMHLIKAAI